MSDDDNTVKSGLETVPAGAAAAAAAAPVAVEPITARILKAELGPNLLQISESFGDLALSVRPEALTAADVPRLAAALRPALRTLLGAAFADQVVKDIVEEFR